ncbi:glycosyl transferase, partial [Bacillus pumilus]
CWIEDEIRACHYFADCYYAVGFEEAALSSLLRSFLYDQPRPEFCCRIGDHLKIQNKQQAAILWYEQALKAPENEAAF